MFEWEMKARWFVSVGILGFHKMLSKITNFSTHCLDFYMVKSYWSFLPGWSLFDKHVRTIITLWFFFWIFEKDISIFKSIIRSLLGTLNKTELWFDCRVIKPALLLTPRFYITRKINGLRWFEPAGSNTACTVFSLTLVSSGVDYEKMTSHCTHTNFVVVCK